MVPHVIINSVRKKTQEKDDGVEFLNCAQTYFERQENRRSYIAKIIQKIKEVQRELKAHNHKTCTINSRVAQKITTITVKNGFFAKIKINELKIKQIFLRRELRKFSLTDLQKIFRLFIDDTSIVEYE